MLSIRSTFKLGKKSKRLGVVLDLVSQGAITHFHMNLKFVIARLPPVEFLQHTSTKLKILRFDNRHCLNFVIAILLLGLAPSNEQESISAVFQHGGR